jgi:hypothetical protein
MTANSTDGNLKMLCGCKDKWNELEILLHNVHKRYEVEYAGVCPSK